MTTLSSDRPSADPNEDMFGHAPFARSLADCICRQPGNDGLVLALYGPWGSGKSTVLGYIQHFLTERADADQPVESWPGKFGQVVEWISCLTAAMMPRIRGER